MKKNIQLLELSNQIKKIAEDIYNNLGSGFEERIYQNALAIELRLRNIKYLKEMEIEIFYKGYSVGVDKPDFLVLFDRAFIVEIKVTDKIKDDNRMQLKSYCTSMQFHSIFGDFMGGMILAFPKSDLKELSSVRMFVTDYKFKVLCDEDK